jgi:predicted RNA-binding Zn-ribbon protein involved in translation (DUF1610 family)
MIFHCPHCGFKAPARAHTCDACGKTMTRPCGECRESISVNATTCKYCGAESPRTGLSAAAAPSPAPRRGRWRRVLLLLALLGIGAAAVWTLQHRFAAPSPAIHSPDAW